MQKDSTSCPESVRTSWLMSAGLMAAIMIVFALPPREFCSSMVSTESRYGTRTFFVPGPLLAASAEMQLPSDDSDCENDKQQRSRGW